VIGFLIFDDPGTDRFRPQVWAGGWFDPAAASTDAVLSLDEFDRSHRVHAFLIITKDSGESPTIIGAIVLVALAKESAWGFNVEGNSQERDDHHF
jgi:hypothetical protein